MHLNQNILKSPQDFFILRHMTEPGLKSEKLKVEKWKKKFAFFWVTGLVAPISCLIFAYESSRIVFGQTTDLSWLSRPY